MMFNTVGVSARTDKRQALDLAKKLLSHLKDKRLRILVDPELAKCVDNVETATPIEEWAPDFVITIGGDGTILRTCIHLQKPEPPILSINLGERGFLTEASPEEALLAIDRSLRGEFTLERCKKLAVSVEGKGLPDALNEVFVSADAPVKLLYADLWKDGDKILECRADGILVASPTGSTGYSVAAGGPVLDPDADVFVATPVCPLTPFPPIVFPERSTLALKIERPKRVSVVVDGHYRKLVQGGGTRVTVTKSDNVTSFIRFRREFYRRLESRLLYPMGRTC